MRTHTIFVAGIVAGVLLTVAASILFQSFSLKFWTGARNGFLIGVGIIFASTVLNYFVSLLDRASQSLRKGE